MYDIINIKEDKTMRCIRLATGHSDSVGIDVDTGRYVYLKFVGPYGHEHAYAIDERMFQNYVLNQTNINKTNLEKHCIATTEGRAELDKLKIIKSHQIEKIRKKDYIIAAEIIDNRNIYIYTIERKKYKIDYKADIATIS